MGLLSSSSSYLKLRNIGTTKNDVDNNKLKNDGYSVEEDDLSDSSSGDLLLSCRYKDYVLTRAVVVAKLVGRALPTLEI